MERVCMFVFLFCFFLGKNRDPVCRWGCGGVNYIGIIIGGQHVPFRQVFVKCYNYKLMSWKLSRALYSLSNNSRPLLLPAATPAALKYLPCEDHIPQILSVTHPD